MDNIDEGNLSDNSEDVNDGENNNINYEDIEQELDLHVPIIGEILGDNDQGADVAHRGVPNGFHDDDEVLDDSSDDDFNDEEIPIQPRIMLGGVMAVLGHQQRVDDSNSDDDDQENDGDDSEEIEESREVFDRDLPGRHSYLGEGREVAGRTILEDDVSISLPLLNQPGLALVPGQLLPLHLFHPSVISMIRNVIQTTKTFGVVSLNADANNWKGLVGTTAEIFEYNDCDDTNDEDEDNRRNIGLKIKARGRQRFQLKSTRRQVDGNLIGEVKLLVDKDLAEPDESLGIPSWKRFQNLSDNKSSTSNSSSPSPSTSSCFSFLSLLKPSSSPSSLISPGYKPEPRWRQKHVSARVLSPHPPWIWPLYSPSHLVERVKQELSKLSSLSPNISAVPSDPTQLSWWLTANLPLEDGIRNRLLSLNSPVQRLRVTLWYLSGCRVLVCRNCGKQLGDQQMIFSMSREGPQGAFVNPGGHVHETLTLYKAKNLRLVGRPSTEYSWFPGYAWTITECLGCWSHIGWKFTATNPKLRPEKFYGFSRKNIEAKVEVPETDVQEDSESTDEINQIVL